MQAKKIDIFTPISQKLEQAAQECRVDADLLANAMVEFLCEELQRPESAGLRLELQEKVRNYGNELFAERVEEDKIVISPEENILPKTP